jgi:diguanylate cyclase (GGDEF)-like protein
MPVNRLNLDDFPDSVYAHELRRRPANLRFDAPLEAEYAATHLQRVHRRVRVWFSLSLVLSILLSVDQARRIGVRNILSLAHLGALVACSIALVWLVWSRQYERFYLPAARVLVPIFYALTTIFIALALTQGREELLAPLTLNLVGVFFFSGLMYRQGLLTSAIMLAAFAAAAILAGLPFAILLKSLVIIMLTGGIATIVYRDVEQSYRRNFLEDALIGELIVRDSLSGLMNRRSFDEHLLRVWQQALRDQRSIAVLMIDIDHFKRYNDDFGHQAGDCALQSVATVVQGVARRPLDLAARYGGEEFAVILYDLALADVQELAERLRQAVQTLEIKGRETGTGAAAEVTVSVGVGLVTPIVGRTPEGAVQLADEALYEAKRAGRNCVIVKGVDAYMLLDTGAFNSPRNSRGRR